MVWRQNRMMKTSLHVVLPAVLAAFLFVLAVPDITAADSAQQRSDLPAQNGGVWHVVKRGDTVYSIARNYGSSVQAITRANHVSNPNRIYVGQRLWIPTRSGQKPQPPGGGVWHVVKRGDTVYSIARNYGSSVRAITRANHVSSPNLIYVGQRLWIPTTNKPQPPPKPPTAPWTGSFFNNKELKGPAVRVERTGEIKYNWGAGGPSGLPTDNFSAAWTGVFNFAADKYRFLVVTDDGARVYVDDNIIINAWRDQTPTGYFRDMTLTAGEHSIRVEYYEAVDDASIVFSWRPL